MQQESLEEYFSELLDSLHEYQLSLKKLNFSLDSNVYWVLMSNSDDTISSLSSFNADEIDVLFKMVQLYEIYFYGFVSDKIDLRFKVIEPFLARHSF